MGAIVYAMWTPANCGEKDPNFLRTRLPVAAGEAAIAEVGCQDNERLRQIKRE